MLFGIVRRGPHTGYGYIRRGKELPGTSGGFDVDAFFEKPNRATAEKYVADANYYSGIFVLHAGTFLAEMEQLAPEVLGAARDAFDAAGEDLGFLRLDGGAFARSPNISVHYAGMEKTKQAAMVPLMSVDAGTWDFRSCRRSTSYSMDGVAPSGDRPPPIVMLSSPRCF